MEKKIQDTFMHMKKSSKLNKLLSDSIETLSQTYELQSANRGAFQQNMAR